jgi:hypothetical protein
MKKLHGLLAGTLLLGFTVPLVAADAKDLSLVVRVFMIPKAQQFESTLADGKGGAINLQVCGNVTSAFPRATVSFPTDLAASACDDAIGAAILDRIVFGSGGLVARKISVRELKSLDFVLGKKQPEAEEAFEEDRGQGRSSHYRVKTELLSADQEKALIRLRFDAGWSAVGGSIGVGISDTVIAAPLELPLSKLFLIGGQSEGTVYWLAVCAVPLP